MLERIELRYLKCFASLKLPFRPLALLSGPGAPGESPVLRAIVVPFLPDTGVARSTARHPVPDRLMRNVTVTNRLSRSWVSSGSVPLNSRIALRMTSQPRPRFSMNRCSSM